MRNLMQFVAELLCKHPVEILKTDEIYVDATTTIKETYLQCMNCMRKHKIEKKFTVASGVFARIENRLEDEDYCNELRKRAAQYAAEMGVEL